MAKVSDAVSGGDAASSTRSKKKEAILGKTDKTYSCLSDLGPLGLARTDVSCICGYIAFTSELQRRLPIDKDDPTAAAALLSQVQKQAQTIERCAGKAHYDMLGDEELEKDGTQLWNLCARLNREKVTKPAPEKPSDGSKLVLWGRVLAFQILHLCHWSSKCTSSVACHLLRLALKVARLCIGLWGPT